jgi:hypothetical protein
VRPPQVEAQSTKYSRPQNSIYIRAGDILIIGFWWSLHFYFIPFVSTAETTWTVAICGSVTMNRCHFFTGEMSGIRLNYTLQFTRNKIAKICSVHLNRGAFSRRNFK